MSELLKKLKYAAESAKALAKDTIQGNELLVDDSKFHERMSICNQCPKYLKETNQCGECLCFLSLKAKGASFKCPLGKW
jgi:hypothetical protein